MGIWDLGLGFRVSRQDSGFRVRGSGFRIQISGVALLCISCLGFRISDFELQVSDFGSGVSGVEFQDSKFGCRVDQHFGLRTSNLEFRFSGFRFQLLGFGFWDCGFEVYQQVGLRLSKFTNQVWGLSITAVLGVRGSGFTFRV